MKRENVKVGEYVVDKRNGEIVKCRDTSKCVYPLVGHENYRKPRISDLSVGDVFEWEGVEFVLRSFDDGKALCSGLNGYGTEGRFVAETKVRIISLAAEKKEPDHGIVKVDPKNRQPIEPEKRSATVWVNCYKNGNVFPYRNRDDADLNAHTVMREACIPVTIEWVKGQGLDDDINPVAWKRITTPTLPCETCKGDDEVCANGPNLLSDSTIFELFGRKP